MNDTFYERLKNDRHFDLVYGTAGVLLTLCSIYQNSPDKKIKRYMDLCADILSSNVKNLDYGCGWIIPHFEKPLTGISHGNAGIALALSRYSEITGESSLNKLIGKVIQLENHSYYPDKYNWRDLRAKSSTKAQFSSYWSHGAPGIGLARLKMSENPDLYKEDYTNAFRNKDWLNLNTSQLGAGKMGIADIYLEASKLTGNDAYLEQSREVIMSVIGEYQQKGYWSCLPDYQSDRFIPGMITGLSGLAYALMRSLSYSDLKTILVLE